MKLISRDTFYTCASDLLDRKRCFEPEKEGNKKVGLAGYLSVVVTFSEY